MELLLIEDEITVGEFLKESLGKETYQVTWCKNKSEVEVFLLASILSFDIVILDRMLAGEDAASLIQVLKKKRPEAKILILSAIDLPQEKARLLDLGADEYLAKPFSLVELTARLRLIGRRAPNTETSNILNLGNLNIDLVNQVAYVNKSKADLTRKELQLLCLFLQKPGRVFNKFQILDRVWDVEKLIESNVVETTIKTLRKKLSDLYCNIQIQNKRNMGYWIEE
jgi:two-component system copper resistance phosphate regulon response regulator CusR